MTKTTKRYRDLQPNDVVRLPANPEEGWPEDLLRVDSLEGDFLYGTFVGGDADGDYSEVPVDDLDAEVEVVDA
jgi:hypothetical protein